MPSSPKTAEPIDQFDDLLAEVLAGQHPDENFRRAPQSFGTPTIGRNLAIYH